MSTQEQRQAVAIKRALLDLLQRHPLAFYDLVMKSRDPQHPFFGNAPKTLVEYGLLATEDSPVNSAIRDVVLQHVVGDGPEMRLINL